MNKTRLTVEDLQIQSFATTSAAGGPRGTVRAHDAPTDQVECPTINADWETCWNTCTAPGGGNTDDCTWMCYTDDCSGPDTMNISYC